MADGLDQAAVAFDADMNPPEAKPRPQSRQTPVDNADIGPVFKNLGEFGKDSDDVAGGDELNDVEEQIYGKETRTKDTKAKNRTDPRNPRESDRENREGDDDESDGDDPDKSDDDESEAEDEEEAAVPGGLDEEDLKTKVEVMVDGQPAEVTLKEALEGYVRTETFHRRMNQLDEAKKIVRRAAGDAVQNYEYSMNVAKQMEAHMEQMIPKEPNWDEEFQKDPAKARDMQRYYEKANAFRASLRSQMEEATKKQLESNQTQLRAFADEENAKFEQANRKNWSDPKKKAKDLTSMRKTALATGFSEDELSQVYDSRMLTVLLKASKFDRMMAARPKPVVRQQAKPIPPGTGSARTRTVQKGADSAMKRLNRTGSLEDAAVVFDNIIAKQG